MKTIELSVRMKSNLKRSQFSSIEEAVAYAKINGLEGRRFANYGRNERKVLNDLLNN